jgi:3-hydroxyisobutyrate dehydrogenase-like beta-hydroxyacid dehydrogenase
MSNAIGFIGLGVMGEPICRNLARKSGLTVFAFDRVDAPLKRLSEVGVRRAESVAELAQECSIIFMVLPSGKYVQSVCEGDTGLLGCVEKGHLIVDLGTSPVEMTRELARRFAAKGAGYADAPIARTRQAAEEGTLSVMVGSDAATFEKLQPLIATFATAISHCGGVGAGQIVKILNNMVVTQTVVALGEALETATRAGLDAGMFFETLAKGSADSFALRNHGMKAMLLDTFPERAFSTEYMRKDITYALDLGKSVGVKLEGAELADKLLAETIAAGYGDLYWPVLLRIMKQAR